MNGNTAAALIANPARVSAEPRPRRDPDHGGRQRSASSRSQLDRLLPDGAPALRNGHRLAAVARRGVLAHVIRPRLANRAVHWPMRVPLSLDDTRENAVPNLM